MVHNENDGCGASPFSGAQTLASTLKATFVAVSGGQDDPSDECGALSDHGFYGPSATNPARDGLEQDVVAKIVGFVSHP
jgi:hypothetical protein